MRRMEKITGRTDDMMILRGVNVFPTQIEELILRTPALSPHFQCVLTGPAGWTSSRSGVERRPAPTPTPPGAAGARLAQLVKNTIGVTVAVASLDPTASSARSARCAASSASERPH